ncbi:hypothetical protein [Mycolicibacterium fortuitum]|uniref:hypothetical protein n=1 Tax=Mycolicibacterium fortuitum TaxID=1766 RepID=UPI002634D907|nr:hypothetical protein [Mycolicibacterium fortuitum]
MIAGFLRGAADFWDAVQAARAEQRTGFSEREAGDYLDASGLADPVVPGFDWEAETNRLALKLHSIRGLANSWRATNLDGISSGDLVLHVAAGTLLEILNEGINFWTPEPEPDDVVDAEVHCEGCKCPTICGCGREIYAEYDRPGAPPLWFHRDDDSPITLQCARIPLAEPTTEDLAEVTAPGAAQPPRTTDVLKAFIEQVEVWRLRFDLERWRDDYLIRLIAEARSCIAHLAEQPVSHEDLAAHITVCIDENVDEGCVSSISSLANYIARELLGDFRISKK